MRMCPICEGCAQPMIFCFVYDGKEYVCPECRRGEPMLNGCRDMELTEEAYDEMVSRRRSLIEKLYEERDQREAMTTQKAEATDGK
jgi:hypothetical protein